MIIRYLSVLGPCERCGKHAAKGSLLCDSCLNPAPQRDHPSVSQQAWARLNREALQRRAYRTVQAEKRAA